MSESSYKSIRNGTIATVLGGAVLLLIPKLREYLFKILSWIWSIIIWVWEKLFDSYSLPGVIWIIILIFTFIGIRKVYLSFRGKKEIPPYKKYVEDLIYGAKWRWDWVGENISKLWCYCPTCDATLVYDNSSNRKYYAEEIKTDFLCEHCNHRVVASIKGGPKKYAIGVVEREIDRRVRTEQYNLH